MYNNSWIDKSWKLYWRLKHLVHLYLYVFILWLRNVVKQCQNKSECLQTQKRNCISDQTVSPWSKTFNSSCFCSQGRSKVSDIGRPDKFNLKSAYFIRMGANNIYTNLHTHLWLVLSCKSSQQTDASFGKLAPLCQNTHQRLCNISFAIIRLL